jgi:hypothetical protein
MSGIEGVFDDGSGQDVHFPTAIVVLFDVACATAVAGFDFDSASFSRCLTAGHRSPGRTCRGEEAAAALSGDFTTDERTADRFKDAPARMVVSACERPILTKCAGVSPTN